ncbi:MAG: phosphoribosyltransferase family protein [Candidatus Micrarchaeaceae archaeon]
MVSLVPALAEAIGKGLDDPFALAPDNGSLELAKSAAAILRFGYARVEKRRDPVTGIASIKGGTAKVLEGRQVVIVDDIVSTGSTAALSAEFAYAHGARSVALAALSILPWQETRCRG